MGIMDNMKSNSGNISDEMKARYQELRDKEQSGMLDDAGRMELQDLRDRMEMDN